VTVVTGERDAFRIGCEKGAVVFSDPTDECYAIAEKYCGKTPHNEAKFLKWVSLRREKWRTSDEAYEFSGDGTD
jgi:hypothetical protein